ncbi:hypothetical protein UC8_26670 [Roseimaritima ulvae]|uniref:Peptidase C39 domain-containing protein n=2 Tax=Roseimaritima ulvae TaxID=980254 RepID=A0A5B9QSE3_9BACT|nr:hypothetical protein UC8_26670 [Roseimaritima ulvae]
MERSVESIYTRVARPDPFGTLAARSYRLAAYAMSCGLEAVTVQCRSERWRDALHYVKQQNLSVIVNHQAAHAPDEGHFSVLTNIDEATVEMDDPFKGPGQRVSLERMHSLWQPNRETVGFILIAIGPRTSEANTAARCESPSCPGCGTRLPLSPSPMFVEADWQADGRWKRFFCHGCDAGFSTRGS